MMRKPMRQLPKIKVLFGLKEIFTICLFFFICLELISINRSLVFERKMEEVPNYSIPQIEKKSIELTNDNTRLIYLKFKNNSQSVFSDTSPPEREFEAKELPVAEMLLRIDSLITKFERALINSYWEIIQSKLKEEVSFLERSNFIDSFPKNESQFQEFILENLSLLELVASNESIDFFEKLDSHQRYTLDLKKDELNFIDLDSSLIDFMPKE